MAILRKKESLVHNIAYMALMAAINVIFIVLDTYVPFLTILLILTLPFVSAVVSYFCQKRYYIIYAAASIGLCLIFNPLDTVFYIVPAVCSGFVIGLLLDKKIHPFWMILASTLIEVTLTYAFIPLFNKVSNTDIIHTFITAFNLTSFAYQQELRHLFILFMALTQCSLTHFVLLTEIKKLGIQTNARVDSLLPYIIGLLSCLIIGLIFALTYTPPALAFIALSFYFAIFLLIDLLGSKKAIICIILGISLLIAFFVFVILYTRIIKPLGLVLFALFPLAISMTSFIKNCLIKCDDNN